MQLFQIEQKLLCLTYTLEYRWWNTKKTASGHWGESFAAAHASMQAERLRQIRRFEGNDAFLYIAYMQSSVWDDRFYII